MSGTDSVSGEEWIIYRILYREELFLSCVSTKAFFVEALLLVAAVTGGLGSYLAFV